MWGMLYDLNMLFTSNLMFLSSLYSSSASQSKFGCFIAGLPIMGPAFCGPSVVVAATACIATLVASVTAFAIASLAFACYLAIFLSVFFVLILPMSAYVRFLLQTACSVSHLIEDDIRWCLCAFIIISWIFMTECIYMCMWLYTWCLWPLTAYIQSAYWLLWLDGIEHASYIHAWLY